MEIPLEDVRRDFFLKTFHAKSAEPIRKDRKKLPASTFSGLRFSLFPTFGLPVFRTFGLPDLRIFRVSSK
jgi:hypothetical protein